MYSTVTASKLYNFEEELPQWGFSFYKNQGKIIFLVNSKAPFLWNKTVKFGRKGVLFVTRFMKTVEQAALAQLGERQTEDLKAPCSIHGGGIIFLSI